MPLANRSTEICFVMQIFTCDPLHQIGQIIFLALCRLDDDAAGLFAYVKGAFLATHAFNLDYI